MRVFGKIEIIGNPSIVEKVHKPLEKRKHCQKSLKVVTKAQTSSEKSQTLLKWFIFNRKSSEVAKKGKDTVRMAKKVLIVLCCR